MGIPLLLGIAFSILFPFILGNFDPFGIEKALADLLAEDKIYSFLRVWRMHLGSYTGAALGTIAVIIYLKISISQKNNPSLS